MTRIAKVEADLKTSIPPEKGADSGVADGLRILARIIARAYLESKKSDQEKRISNEGGHGTQGTGEKG